MVFVNIENNKEFDFDINSLSKKIINEILNIERISLDISVNISVLGLKKIRTLNCNTRGIDKPTDVLSFPGSEFPEPGNFDHLEEKWEDSFNPESGELMLGDIVISVDKVAEQAEAYGHSEIRELSFLVAHSMLHLMGYDHMEEDERLLMEQRQEEILQSIGYTRD